MTQTTSTALSACSPENGCRRARRPRSKLWRASPASSPILHRASQRPFEVRVSLLGDPFTIRMDAWLPSDTFRRGGFGHVIRGREQVLFVERGQSLVWFSADGSPVVAYAAGPYAPKPRFGSRLKPLTSPRDDSAGKGAKVRGCEGAKVRRCEGAKVRRCEGAKVRRCEGAKV